MDEELIKNYLSILEINSYEELTKFGVDNFWQKKFKKIHSDTIGSKKKETLLIQINNARDSLNDIDLDDLKRFINNANRKKASNNNEANKRTTSSDNDANKIKTNNSDANDSSKNTYQRTEKSLIGIKHPKALIGFFVIVFAGLISIPFIQKQNPYKTANRNQIYEKKDSNSNKKIFKTKYYDNGRFEGDFINGKKTGRGTYYFNNGDRYEGNFINGERTGKGTYYFNNGNTYKGDWVNDKRNGRGTFFWSNGERYEGDFINGEMTGKGTFYFNNGNIYKGDCLKGNFHGYGTYYWPTGERYSGYWLNNKRNGYGTYSDSSGYSEEQYWNNGQLQR